jgi:hypothetical protein
MPSPQHPAGLALQKSYTPVEGGEEPGRGSGGKESQLQ